MVALGPEEAEYLNARARDVLTRTGTLFGPAVELGGRVFQQGDDVAALGRDARLGGVAGGTVGRVTAVDPERARATIRWPGRPEPVTIGSDQGAVPLTHGYATTPSFLRGGYEGRLLSLGDTGAVAPHLHPERIYQVLPLPIAARARDGPDQAIAWRAAALGLGAEIRPTAAVEAHLGAPPIDAARRPAWRQAAEAIEAHRDRLGLPDRPLDLTRPAEPERRVLAATKAFERAASGDRALDRRGP
jgi:hypothetical protein